MPTTTYTPLANLTLSSTATTVTFSSISQAYRDLVVVVDSPTVKNLSIRFNNDTGTNCWQVGAWGDGTSAVSTTHNNSAILVYYTALNGVFQVMDYSATDKHKPVLVRSSGASQAAGMVAGRYASTSAVTALTVLAHPGASVSFDAGTSFALYGIAA